jgi:hypothetical protein
MRYISHDLAYTIFTEKSSSNNYAKRRPTELSAKFQYVKYNSYSITNIRKRMQLVKYVEGLKKVCLEYFWLSKQSQIKAKV